MKIDAPKASAILLCLASLSSSYAQSVPQEDSPPRLTIETSYRKSRNVAIKQHDQAVSQMDKEDHSFELSYAWDLGSRGQLETSLYRNQTQFDYDNQNSPFPSAAKLYSTGLSLTLLKPYKTNWTSLYGIDLGWRNFDEEESYDEGFGTKLTAAMLWEESPQLHILFGAQFDTLANENQFTPIFGIQWRPSENWQFSFGFPETGVFYQLTESLRIGFAIQANLETYRYRSFPNADHSEQTFDYQDIYTDFQIDYQINRNFLLTLSMGAVAFRKFEVSSIDSELETDSLTGGGVSLSLSASF